MSLVFLSVTVIFLAVLGGHVALMGGRGMYRVLVWKPEGKRSLGRPGHRWENSIKMDLQEVGCGGCGLDRAGSG